MAINAIGVGFAAGGSIHYARKLAEGREREGNELFINCLYAVLGIGLLISLFALLFPDRVCVLLGAPDAGDVRLITRTYARIVLAGAPLALLNIVGYFFVDADNDAYTANLGLIAGNLVDLALNALLILVFKLGAEGAAYSTVAGNAVSIVVYISHFYKRREKLRSRKAKVIPQQTFRSFITGFSSSVQYLFQFAALLIINTALMRRGQSYVAVYDVLINVIYVLCAPAQSVGTAAQPLIATFFAERNERGVRHVLRLSYTLTLLLCASMACAAFVFARPFALLFGFGSGASLSLCIPF